MPVDKRERNVLVPPMVWDGRTYADIARELGVTPSQAGQIYLRGCKFVTIAPPHPDTRIDNLHISGDMKRYMNEHAMTIGMFVQRWPEIGGWMINKHTPGYWKVFGYMRALRRNQHAYDF